MIDTLKIPDVTPDEIGDDENLFEGRLGIDSVDALELVMALQRNYKYILMIRIWDVSLLSQLTPSQNLLLKNRQNKNPDSTVMRGIYKLLYLYHSIPAKT